MVKVKVLTEGVHSGDASGIVPSSFRIIRELISRIENETTGEVVEDFQVIRLFLFLMSYFFNYLCSFR